MDLQAALDVTPATATAFAALRGADRCPVVLQVVTAPDDTVRAARIARQTDRLITTGTTTG